MSDGRASVWLWRLCNLLMAAFFGLAAAVQVNDPDAGLWTSLTGAFAIGVCGRPRFCAFAKLQEVQSNVECITMLGRVSLAPEREAR